MSCECKKHCTCTKVYNWNLRSCICEKGKYLKSIADTLVIVCDKIINATDNVLTNITNTIPTNMTNIISANVASTVSRRSDDKKVRYKMKCYIFHSVLLFIILLFTIIIIWYHHAKYRSEQKRIGALTK